MSEYIPRDDYLPYSEDLLKGEQIHINHDNCTAGVDTKRRLYIKRTDDGHKLLAYCHNCSLRGSYGAGIIRADEVKSRVGLLVKQRQTYTRGDGEHEFSIKDVTPWDGDGQGWEVEQRAWVSKYGFTDVELDMYKIGYSSVNKSVTLPVYRYGKLLGYQERTFKEGLPKYLTTATSKPLWWFSGDYIYNIVINPPTTVMVLVEDMLSGIKCARFKPTIAVLGAVVGDALKEFIISKMDKDGTIIIFLDDDNRQIRLSQLKIKVNMEQLGYRVKLITGVNKDPKECSNKELGELLKL